jgi:hypothetical protein
LKLRVVISPLLSQSTAVAPAGSTNPGKASPKAACGSRVRPANTTRDARTTASRSRGSHTSRRFIGAVHNSRGDDQTTLDYFEQALPILREVGDRAGEATTRFNIAMVYRGAGRLVEAVAELELVVALDAAVELPVLEADTALLEEVRVELQQGRSGRR